MTISRSPKKTRTALGKEGAKEDPYERLPRSEISTAARPLFKRFDARSTDCETRRAEAA